MLCRQIIIGWSLNLNLQVNATSALCANDSLNFLLENFTQTYSKKYDFHKRIGGERAETVYEKIFQTV